MDPSEERVETPSIHFEDVLVRETGADLRLRGQNIWNVAQFFTGLVASLMAVSFALFAGAVPSVNDSTRAAAVLAVSLVAGLLGLGAVYTFVFECFHWAHARRNHQRVIGEWLNTGPATRWEVACSLLNIDLQVLLARVSTPREYRKTVLTSDGPPQVKSAYLYNLHDEILPQKGTRYLLRMVLYVLTGLSAGVSFLAGALLGSTLTASPSLPVVFATAAAALVPYLAGWALLRHSFESTGITSPDPEILLFDLDKTLIDLAPADSDWKVCDAQVRTLVAGSPVADSGNATAYEIYRNALNSLGKTAPLTRAIAASLDEWEVRFVNSSAQPMPGLESLAKLAAAGHVFGIVSSNGRKCLDALFATGKLHADWFSVVVTRDDVPDIKPSAVPLKLAWDRSPVTYAGWFVGDSLLDLESYRSFTRDQRLPLKFAMIETGTRSDSAAPVHFGGLDQFVHSILREG